MTEACPASHSAARRRRRRRALEVGRRVYLAHPTPSDGEEFIDVMRRSRRLHGRWITAPTSAGAYAELVRRSRRPRQDTCLVCRLEDDAIAGLYTIGEIVRGALEGAFLGYYAARPCAGQGYMTEGMHLLLRRAFTALRLHRLEANIQPENGASLALVRRAGFRREGFSPRYLKINGRWRDHERWAILAEEWRRRPRG